MDLFCGNSQRLNGTGVQTGKSLNAYVSDFSGLSQLVPIKHLRCSFFTEIVNGLELLTIFAKKPHLKYLISACYAIDLYSKFNLP